METRGAIGMRSATPVHPQAERAIWGKRLFSKGAGS
jgi:hypothetical protein